MKQRTPRVDGAELLKRTFDFDVFACARCGGRLKGVGVREGRQGSASDTGALGLAPSRCEASPGARAPSGREVLRLKLPGPGEPSACRAPEGRAARAGVYSKGLRGLSTRLAHGSGGPSQRPSTTPPLLPSPSTWLLSCLYA
jgi:hypothetical protein